MWINWMILAFLGLSFGLAISAGLFAFLIGLGVVSDFADRTHTGKYVTLYEDCIVLGGILGNLFWIYEAEFLKGGMLVHGTGGYFKYFPDFHPQGKDYNGTFVAHCRNGTWKKFGRIIVFLYEMVKEKA